MSLPSGTWKRQSSRSSAEGKVNAYLAIAKMAWHKLAKKDEVIDLERLRVADVAIGALQEAEKVAPDNVEVQTYLAAMFDYRSMAHGAAWAQIIDRANMLQHQLKRNALMETLKEQQETMAPTDQSPADGEDG